LPNCRTIFDPDKITTENEELAAAMSRPDFWKQDRQVAAGKAEQYDLNNKILGAEDDLMAGLASIGERIAQENYHPQDPALLKELEHLQEKLTWLESQTLFSGPYDDKSAYVMFHVGAGGVDAADWNEMLLGMYLAYARRRGWQAEVVHLTAGEEAGIKNATLKVSGYRAYGYLKAEAGVHRLVRLSPFNAQNLRQTSFALVEVLPDLGEIEVELDEKDLKIDTFKSSGHGGQSVNTTDSAVRITHLPTGLTAAFQNERSQMQNREAALKILKNKLYVRQQEEREQRERKLKAATSSGDFGQQVRSYVLHPYQQVKDHRSDFTEPRTDKILKDGDLDELIVSVLVAERDADGNGDKMGGGK
jgi:peptide chain release factor 2